MLIHRPTAHRPLDAKQSTRLRFIQQKIGHAGDVLAIRTAAGRAPLGEPGDSRKRANGRVPPRPAR